MAKIKITKEEAPFLKENIELDAEALEKLKSAQEAYRKEFAGQIEAGQKEALERYSAKVEALKQRKSAMLKAYNAEIEKYQAMVEELKGAVEAPPQKQAGGKGKATRKKSK